MSIQTPTNATATSPLMESPPVEVETPLFSPSQDLAEQLLQDLNTQLKVDRARAEELARLRQIQDRD